MVLSTSRVSNYNNLIIILDYTATRALDSGKVTFKTFGLGHLGVKRTNEVRFAEAASDEPTRGLAILVHDG